MEWKSVSTEMPEAGIMVLAYFKNDFGKHRRIRTFYAPKFGIEASEEDDCEDYDEKSDTYYLTEGWYEQNEFEETHWAVTGNITHWMPLPPPPE